MNKLLAAWNFLSGKKTVIVAVLLILAKLYPNVDAFHYVGTLLTALGWSDVVPAIDPANAAVVVSGAIAIGHKLVKAANAEQKAA